jgi:hypothetical protein
MEKMYVLIRSDLSKSQQAVQGGHVVAEYIIQHGNTSWKNGVLVYLIVPYEIDLIKAAERLTEKGHKIVSFYEPDINEVTAIAIVTDDEDLFKDVLLL